MKKAHRALGVIVSCMTLLCGSSVFGDDWPQWRGPNRDNKITGFTAPSAWPKDLTQKWKVTVGLGDSSPVMVGDKIYVFTRQGGDEVTLCLDASNGNELWKDKYPAVEVTGGPRPHPGPRSSPAVAEGKVCTLGVGGVVSCLDAAKGTVLWRKDTKAYPKFYTSSSPIIVEGKCIVQVGTEGDGGIAAYDLTSGDEKWKWTGAGPAYSSPELMTVDGVKQIVAMTEKSVVGLAAADGKPLWQVPFEAKGMMATNSFTPIVDGPLVIYGRDGTGTTAIKVEKKDDGFAAKQLWQKDKAACRFNTPVLKDGLLYGLASAGRGAANFFCMKADSGDVVWTDSGKRGECGAILDAGSVLLALTSDSNLEVFQPSDKGYMEVAKFKVADSPTWAEPIVAGNRVIVKDKDSLILWSLE